MPKLKFRNQSYSFVSAITHADELWDAVKYNSERLIAVAQSELSNPQKKSQGSEVVKDLKAALQELGVWAN